MDSMVHVSCQGLSNIFLLSPGDYSGPCQLPRATGDAAGVASVFTCVHVKRTGSPDVYFVLIRYTVPIHVCTLIKLLVHTVHLCVYIGYTMTTMRFSGDTLRGLRPVGMV